MKVLCQCDWEQAGTTFQADDVEFVFNEYRPDVDFFLDVQRPFTELSRRFPPSHRCIVLTEPSPLTDYGAASPESLAAHYQGLILSHHQQMRGFRNHWVSHTIAGKWVPPVSTAEGKEFGVVGFVSPKFNPSFPGYVLRRHVLHHQFDIKTPSVVYNFNRSWKGVQHDYPVPSKEIGNKYMFQLAIENCVEPGYFTEKLIDCFASYTVPLYMGDPDLGQIFDESGIIRLTHENAIDVINSLTPDDYTKRLKAVEYNFERSKEYWHHLRTWARDLKAGLSVMGFKT